MKNITTPVRFLKTEEEVTAAKQEGGIVGRWYNKKGDAAFVIDEAGFEALRTKGYLLIGNDAVLTEEAYAAFQKVCQEQGINEVQAIAPVAGGNG